MPGLVGVYGAWGQFLLGNVRRSLLPFVLGAGQWEIGHRSRVLWIHVRSRRLPHGMAAVE
jgi:hypothetical protein